MRVAILADIHGNPSALNAVLHDIDQQGGVDEYWVLGDLCAIDYDPSGVLDCLSRLKNARFIRGNTDRYVTSGARPAPSLADVQADNKLLTVFAEVMGSFAWTHGHLAGRGWIEWLAALPLDIRLTLPDGTRVLLVHSQPGADDGNGLNPGLSDSAVRTRVEGCEADLICIGHFHTAMDRRVDGLRIINPGCVSNPSSGKDLRPTYVILQADADGHTIAFCGVDYDYSADIQAVKRCGIPGGDFIIRALTGKLHIGWMDSWDGITHAPSIR